MHSSCVAKPILARSSRLVCITSHRIAPMYSWWGMMVSESGIAREWWWWWIVRLYSLILCGETIDQQSTQPPHPKMEEDFCSCNFLFLYIINSRSVDTLPILKRIQLSWLWNDLWCCVCVCVCVFKFHSYTNNMSFVTFVTCNEKVFFFFFG